MRTPASIAKHPIHPMLIVFPVGLWIFSLICDLIALRAAPESVWSTMAFHTMVGGLVGALAAAVPGFIDLLSLADRQIKRIAVIHMAINLAVVALYAMNIWLRASDPTSMSTGMSTPVLLSIIGVALLFVSGWLGGQMVHVYGVGVEGRE